MELWRKAQDLNRLQWKSLACSLVMLPLIDISLRLAGYKRSRDTLAALAKSRSPANSEADIETVGEQMARVVSIAGRRSPWPTTCLRQALMLWFLLNRRGIVCEVRVGVENSVTSGFAAHAWVERNGRVLIGGEHAQARYVVLV